MLTGLGDFATAKHDWTLQQARPTLPHSLILSQLTRSCRNDQAYCLLAMLHSSSFFIFPSNIFIAWISCQGVEETKRALVFRQLKHWTLLSNVTNRAPIREMVITVDYLNKRRKTDENHRVPHWDRAVVIFSSAGVTRNLVIQFR